ncbi:tetratricopeptide repeat protein [Marichromatium bheemlicum]|uniref:Sel1 repeat family protein n=1 Tax=Marichromatium bheemlicum TaxID=365339 RepID=A0ABX1IBW0_9GAMM|nr:tetratricopeptide repeat protein [Marichromatium bheemlicum]NKN34504.1 sel1 repeat family protein [Marichromatium bheemlicum]
MQSRRYGLRSWFRSWFRCCDCGARFICTDYFLIQQWSMIGVAVVVIAGVGGWALLHQPDGGLVVSDPAEQDPVLALLAPQPPLVAERLAEPEVSAAAESGDPDAQYQLGLAIVQRYWERGEQRRLGEAADWIRKAAEQDHVRAQLVMGGLYEKGRGVIQDYESALAWYRRAAAQGDPQAMARLGRMLRTGRGVEKNLVEAYVWLNLAAARGDPHAEIDRDRLRRMLSDNEIDHAQDRSRHFDDDLPRPSGPAQPLPLGF